MRKTFIGTMIFTASSSLWAATIPDGLPSAYDVQEAVEHVSAIQGAIDGLVSAADGESSDLENDRLARSILLKMSENTNDIVDDLDSLDHLLAAKKYAEAAKLQKAICGSLTKLKSDNQNARTGADLPDVGNISGQDPQFADINSDIRDTQKVLKCK